MNPRLRAEAARQGGVFTRRQAVSSGCSEREIKTRTGALGDWAVVRRGVYAERVTWEAADEVGRYRLRVRAALAAAGGSAIPSHTSSAALLGLPTRPHWHKLVHVTRLGVTGGRTEGGVKHHRAHYTELDLSALGRLKVMGAARTAIDIAREHGFEDGVVATDAALRVGADRATLQRVLDGMRNWPGVTAARAASAVADGGAQSIGETLLRLLVLELDLGVPETQFVISDGRRRAEIDLRLKRHLFEFDGKVKYLGREQGGVAQRPPEEVVWAEKRREDWVRNHAGGYGMSRVVWSELLGRARDDTKRRLYREFMASEARFGHLE